MSTTPSPVAAAAPATPVAPAPPTRDQIIDAVTKHMQGGNPNTCSPDPLLVYHPPTAKEKWHYTLTYQLQVQDGANKYVIRGHVHYKEVKVGDVITYSAGPGKFWISGKLVEKWDLPTPNTMVQRFASHAFDGNAARAEFNQRHKTNFDVSHVDKPATPPTPPASTPGSATPSVTPPAATPTATPAASATIATAATGQPPQPGDPAARPWHRSPATTPATTPAIVGTTAAPPPRHRAPQPTQLLRNNRPEPDRKRNWNSGGGNRGGNRGGGGAQGGSASTSDNWRSK